MDFTGLCWTIETEKGPDFSGPFVLSWTKLDCCLVAMQGLEPRTLRI